MSNYIAKHIAKGNRKLPHTTLIFNPGTCRDCVSRKLGLCQCPDKCYGDKAETQYPDCLPYRERQFRITREVDPADFANAVIDIHHRAKSKPDLFRFAEAGDFHDQRQLDWFNAVAGYVQGYTPIRCYAYTARVDLDLSHLARNCVINLSHDPVEAYQKKFNRFKIFREGEPDAYICPGNCRICSMCAKQHGKTVYVKEH